MVRHRTDHARAATAKWLQFEMPLRGAGNHVMKGTYLTDELIPVGVAAGRLGPEHIPVNPGVAWSDGERIDYAEQEGQEILWKFLAELPLRFYVKLGGKMCVLHDTLGSWGRRVLKEQRDIDRLEYMERQDYSISDNNFTSADASIVLRILGFYSGGISILSKPDKLEIIKKFYIEGKGPFDEERAGQMQPATIKDRWSWKTGFPEEPADTWVNRELWLNRAREDTEDRIDPNDNTLEDLSPFEDRDEDPAYILELVQDIKNDDAIDEDILLIIHDTTMHEQLANVDPEDVAEVEKEQRERMKALATACAFFASFEAEWLSDDRKTLFTEATPKGDERRAKMLFLAITVVLLGDKRECVGTLEPILVFLAEHLPAFTEEVREKVLYFTSKEADDPEYVKEEWLYPDNITRFGRSAYREIHSFMEGKWEAWASDRPYYKPEHEALTHIFSSQQVVGNEQGGGGDGLGVGTKALIEYLQTSASKSKESKSIPNDVWDKVISGELKPCLVDVQDYFKTDLLRLYPKEHEVRKILAANGLTAPEDFCSARFDSADMKGDKMSRIADDKILFRDSHNPGLRLKTVRFYDAILTMVCNSPLGFFDEEIDFMGVDIKKVNQMKRLIDQDVIKSADSARLDASEWFLYMTKGKNHLLDTAVVDDKLSTQTSQVLALAQMFDDATAMKKFALLNRRWLDIPQTQKIAQKSRFLENIFFWSIKGFSHPHCEFKSVESFVDRYISKATTKEWQESMTGGKKKRNWYEADNNSSDSDGQATGNRKRKKVKKVTKGGNGNGGNGNGNGGRPTLRGAAGGAPGGGGNLHHTELSKDMLPPLSSVQQNAPDIPGVWAKHVFTFPASYGTSEQALSARSDSTCGICRKQKHNRNSCIMLLLLKRWKKGYSPSGDDKQIANDFQSFKKHGCTMLAIRS